MELPQLQSEELSLLEFLEQNSVDGAASNGGALLSQAGNIIGQDENLASIWHNTPFIGGFNQNMSRANEQCEIFSDTESLTSCGSAVASPAVFEHTEQSQFTFPLQDQDLRQLSVKELNVKLKGQPKDIVKAAKKRRRTLKNRGYAHSCRIKRIMEKSILQRSKQELQEVITSQQQELTAVSNERDACRNQCEKLIEFLKQNYSFSG